MDKKISRRETRLLLFLLTLFLGLGHLIAVNAHRGPLFHVNPAAVQEITVHSGKCAASISNSTAITDRERIEEIVRLLNGFTYTKQEELPLMAGGCDSLSLAVPARSIRIAFGDNYVRSYRQDGSSVVYYGPSQYFHGLVQLAEEAFVPCAE